MRLLACVALAALATAAAPAAAAAISCQSVKSDLNGNGERYLGVTTGVASAVRLAACRRPGGR